MEISLLNHLRQITPEEQAILDGRRQFWMAAPVLTGIFIC